ncbi:hypothetical protein HG426_001640 [Candidatus Saccharibacteria bacterium]|nr:hypothetical protein [Candidatus Saccharibacteria bacterium]
MSVPIPPPNPHDQTPLWRRLITTTLLLAIWPAGALILLLGSAAGEENPLGRGFTALAEAPWWALTSAAMALVTVTLFAIPVSLRLAADITIGASALALVLSWGLDPATTDITGTPLWGCLLFSVGIALIDAGYNLQERRAARPPRGGNGA